eukprot:symbB.v1.2.032167.t1/scaffold3815.1/size82879/2
MLLTLCAVLNVSLCLGMSYSGVLCLLGIQKVAKELQSEAVEIVQEEGIQHVIIIANYKEITLKQTTSIGCTDFSSQLPTVPLSTWRMASTASPVTRRPRLSLLALSAIIYYSVSGGPYGAEDAVASAGPLLSLAGFLFMPLVWSLPEALVTAELATTFPSNAGFVEWVTAAFGPFWGFQEGFLSWISSVADASLYPVLFRQYLEELWPQIFGGFYGQIFVVAVTLLMGVLNLAGLSIVGWVAFLLAGFVLSPFLYMVVVGIPQISMERLLVSPPVSEVQWSDFLNTLFWNLNYWDTASTLAGEVEDVKTTYPKALAIALVAVVLSYFLPLLVGLGVSGSDWRNWKDGQFAELGHRLGGSFLKSWVICGAAVSCLGQQLSEMAEAAFQLQGMAEDGWLPSCFAQRSRFDTPWLPLLVITVLVLVPS